MQDLLRRIEAEAKLGGISLDLPVYAQAGKDPFVPIFVAGSLSSPVCVLGRDLGAQEVRLGEPLIGSGGKKVRQGIANAVGITADLPPCFPQSMQHAIFTNTVPYKPEGNKVYAPEIRERFRPFLSELICTHWQGNNIITLGNEAFFWFAPYTRKAELNEFWSREDRYTASISCSILSNGISKSLNLLPLPHPSPLNRIWTAQFPGLLVQRLKAIYHCDLMEAQNPEAK